MASLRNRLCPARSSRVQSVLHCVTRYTVSSCPIQEIALRSPQNLETSLTPPRLLLGPREGRRVAGGGGVPQVPACEHAVPNASVFGDGASRDRRDCWGPAAMPEAPSHSLFQLYFLTPRSSKWLHASATMTKAILPTVPSGRRNKTLPPLSGLNRVFC